MTVLKDEVGHMSAKLGGVRKGDKVYFDLDRMLQAENRSFLVSKIIFGSFCHDNLLAPPNLYHFYKKPKSLSESLTEKTKLFFMKPLFIYYFRRTIRLTYNFI